MRSIGHDSLVAQTVALEHIAIWFATKHTVNVWLLCGIRIRSGRITVLGTCSLVWA